MSDTPDPREYTQPKPAHPAAPKGLHKPSMPPPGTAKPVALPPGGLPAGSAGAKLPPGAAPLLPPSGKKPGLPPGGAPGGDGDALGLGLPVLTRKDFSTDQDVRWCPGCGDYAILAAVQRLMPELGVTRENTVFVSGIGCSSRFPYYMNTYGFHSIHGRATTIASGLKASRPDLDVWIVTGDGDALSIGGNHLIHLLRRNFNVNLLLFNNQIYGLTKGQYSPTSEEGKVTKSTPYGSIDHPFNPLAVALGADATFVARTLDRDPKHLSDTLRRAHVHHGASFVEVYQNCNIFNDGAFFEFTERDQKPARTVMLEHGRPLVFDAGKRGLRLDGLRLEVIDLEAGALAVSDCLVYDETNRELAHIAARMFWQEDLPRPFGVFYREDRPTYEDALHAQADAVLKERGRGDLKALLAAGETWEIL